MPKIDDCEHEILSAYEKGQLKSVATKEELAKFKAAARATAIKAKLGRYSTHCLRQDEDRGSDQLMPGKGDRS